MTHFDSDFDGKMMESNPSLRFVYDMDDDILLSPDGSLNGSTSSRSIEWTKQHAVLSPPLSPTSDVEIHHEHGRPVKRNSIRNSLSHVFASPVRAAAKGKLSFSPRKVTPKPRVHNSKSNKEWRKQLDLPKDVKPDEAIAVLLAKELTMLDF
ncbi:hypothetical protein IV203_027500 [Nitzschia inconspicua]|uniref:Uncharacterized protein n=1 Tax=Nitzschia inconspicua TaxID=303405 RepID=A0A9K3LWC2_9STRA|nr:hypothetical protein IV203_027500 [Nitzschia inconspicua]